MSTFNLFEFMLATHEGIEQGLEGTERAAQELALGISEVSMTVPFGLLFERDCGFRVLPTGTHWVSRTPLNLARVNIRWRMRDREEAINGRTSEEANDGRTSEVKATAATGRRIA